MKISVFLFVTALVSTANAQNSPIPSSQTFTNPLLPSGADPWVTQQDGMYYFMCTTGTNLTIYKTRSMPDLKTAEKKVVWTAPPSGPYSHDIWAPELHLINGKWYIYFAADAAKNDSHRLWVIENKSSDPLDGTWSEPRKLATSDDKWAIDGSVFEDKGKLYLIWSGWEGDRNGAQNIYIARMRNPLRLTGKRVRLSSPGFPWETVGDLPGQTPSHVNVNEGPEILRHRGKLFLIYSASGCWTDSYALGELTALSGTNLLDSKSWKKSERPVLSTLATGHAYSPGHNSFFKSPDGQEDWIVYHANAEPHQGCGNQRSPRAQRFTWDADGAPNFGLPVSLGQPIPRPR